MKNLTIPLRLVLCLILILLTLVCIYTFPDLISYRGQPEMPTILKVLLGIGLYLSGILSYAIIYFSWRLLHLIDHNHLFSAKGVSSLKIIRNLFYTIAIIYAAMFPLFAFITSDDCSPVGGLMEMFVIMLGLMVGTFVHVLQKVSQDLVNSKKETELSI
ncbi:DUF2975 domain-containing protein [Companilactobacillus jidongensis]|uniref:DUF2975 domain-containing protein n=1 Tax=Companilactobacillus jidongensis TaxID=2486006 RepID=UPI000F788796|nr:DUF2975 domain-containing protein [Companilactobacillus jidongensis]